MKHAGIPALLIAIIFFMSLTAGLSVTIAEESTIKGNAFHAQGSCIGGSLLQINATAGRRAIFTTTSPCQDGNFEFSYTPGLADPSGSWTLTFQDSEETKTGAIEILPSKASGYLIVSFLSPAQGIKKRGDSIPISVKVTDAGNAVEGASVFFWTQEGEKIALNAVGDGTYGIDSEVPLSAALEDWKLTVLAVSADGQSGGEGVLILPIERPEIQFEILAPKGNIIEAGSAEEWKVKATYGEDKPFAGKLEAKIGGASAEFLNTGGGVYSGKVPVPGDLQLNATDIEFSASDEFGNHSSKINHYIIGGQINFLIKGFGIYILTALVVLFTIGYWITHHLNAKKSKEQLKREKEAIEGRIAELNRNYFEKNLLSKAEFNQRAQALNVQLSDIESRLK